MPLIITCTGCRTQLRVGDEHAGRKFRCPDCKTVLTTAAAPPLPIKTDSGPPPRRPARRDDDEDDRPVRALRRGRTPAQDEQDPDPQEAELHEWERWADRHLRRYLRWLLLPGALFMGLLAIGLLVKPLQKPGLESLWAVLALLSALQFATWVGFEWGMDWPFGTLLTAAPVVVSNLLLRLVRTAIPFASLGDAASQVCFLAMAAGMIALVWWWLQRPPNRSSTDRILAALDKAHPKGFAEDLLSLGQFLRVAASAVTLVWMRFQREPQRRQQLLIGLGAGCLAYVVFLLLTIMLIGTVASRNP